MRRHASPIAGAVLLATLAGAALAGPPLTTEDPGVLAPGELELIVAATVTGDAAGRTWEFPVLDLSLGLLDDLQVSAAVPYVTVDPDGGPSDGDVGNPEFGLKWRIVNNQRLQLAFAPLYAFGVSVTKELGGIGDSRDVLFLPLTGQLALDGDWTLTADAGYGIVRGGRDSLGYGAYLGRPLGSRANVYVELHGSADKDFRRDFMNFHLGFDFELAAGLSLLFAGGAGLWAPGGEEAADYDVYLGLQLVR